MKKEEQGKKSNQRKELPGLSGKKTAKVPGIIPKRTELSDEDLDKVAGGRQTPKTDFGD